MAKGKKRNGNNKKQGIVSWATSWIQVILTLANPVARIYEGMQQPAGQKLSKTVRYFIKDYSGVLIDDGWKYVDFDWTRMIRGYGPPAVGYAQKKIASRALKGVKVTLIPKLW